ncbi:hypothetical protein SAMN05421869_101222 [Nonomuraea jiangxiensis]|uniref:Uncharacterized protein n=1 Tax=Nonomuraea jiangxiensis TaxID=633440 RepID=A0A1G7YVA8_9ACTN|nr:hypothetical protein SAMN05421869_101222 [Nonomuraea jiangxiensis]
MHERALPDLSSWMDDALPRGEILYWWIAAESDDRGAGGVTLSGNLAAARLVNALTQLSPGADGSVVRVALDRSARAPSYRHGTVLLRVRRDEVTGTILYQRGPGANRASASSTAATRRRSATAGAVPFSSRIAMGSGSSSGTESTPSSG